MDQILINGVLTGMMNALNVMGLVSIICICYGSYLLVRWNPH